LSEKEINLNNIETRDLQRLLQISDHPMGKEGERRKIKKVVGETILANVPMVRELRWKTKPCLIHQREKFSKFVECWSPVFLTPSQGTKAEWCQQSVRRDDGVAIVPKQLEFEATAMPCKGHPVRVDILLQQTVCPPQEDSLTVVRSTLPGGNAHTIHQTPPGSPVKCLPRNATDNLTEECNQNGSGLQWYHGGTITTPLPASVIAPTRPPPCPRRSRVMTYESSPDTKRCRTMTNQNPPVGTPSFPPNDVQKWFVTSLVEIGTNTSKYIARTTEILRSESLVERIFGQQWERHRPKYYAHLGCWLPDLAKFKRHDAKTRTWERSLQQHEWGVLHSDRERTLLLLSFGFKSDSGTDGPASLNSYALGRHLWPSYFYQFELKPDNQIGLWWPVKYNEKIFNISEFIKLATAEAKANTSIVDRPSLLSLTSVVNETYRDLNGKDFGLNYNTGGPIYAEPTLQSSLTLNETLSEVGGEAFSQAVASQATLFIDLGAGTGTFISSLARPRNCPVLAVEFCKTRCILALHTMLEVSKKVNRECPFPYKVAYLPMNIYEIKSLEPPAGITFMVVYLGDEAFEPNLMKKIRCLLSGVSVQMILVTDKAGRHSGYTDFWQNYQFKEIARRKWKKRGGNQQSGTFFVYGRKALPDNGKVYDEQIQNVLERCGNNASDDDRISYYQETLSKINDGTYPHELHGADSRGRRSRSTKSTICESSKTMMHCGMECSQCRTLFSHCPSKVKVDTSPVHENGLFAQKGIEKGKFIVRCGGRHVDDESDLGASVIKTEDGYIDVSHMTLHNGYCKYVNHGCEPNVELRKWKTIDGTTATSMVAIRDIVEGEELLRKYLETNFKCMCVKCRPKRGTIPRLGMT
jgi:hypothetical protein